MGVPTGSTGMRLRVGLNLAEILKPFDRYFRLRRTHAQGVNAMLSASRRGHSVEACSCNDTSV